MGPGIGHHSMGVASSFKGFHTLEQLEDSPEKELLGILVEQLVSIHERTDMVLLVEGKQKLAYLKHKELLLEHSMKEIPASKFLLELLSLSLLTRHTVTLAN